MEPFNGNAIVARELEVVEAHVLNAGRWMSEEFLTFIGILQNVTGLLLAFSLLALVAYAVVRSREQKGSNPPANA